MPEKIIMYDSDDAATYREGLSGWVSSEGRFFGKDENLARYSGSTHKRCECGNIHEKAWMKCEACRNKSADERYLALEYREWKGEPVVLRDHESYFFDDGELYDRMVDEGWDTVDVLFCEPNYAPYIEEYAIDLMPEDQYIDDVHPKLADMLAEINDYISKNKPIISWSGGKQRTTIALPESYK